MMGKITGIVIIAVWCGALPVAAQSASNNSFSGVMINPAAHSGYSGPVPEIEPAMVPENVEQTGEERRIPAEISDVSEKLSSIKPADYQSAAITLDRFYQGMSASRKNAAAPVYIETSATGQTAMDEPQEKGEKGKIIKVRKSMGFEVGKMQFPDKPAESFGAVANQEKWVPIEDDSIEDATITTGVGVIAIVNPIIGVIVGAAAAWYISQREDLENQTAQNEAAYAHQQGKGI